MHKITPGHDAKLQHLKTRSSSKLASPINPGNRKVLIFSAFADTAEYLYEQLAPQLSANSKTSHGARHRRRTRRKIDAWARATTSSHAHALLAAVEGEGT